MEKITQTLKGRKRGLSLYRSRKSVLNKKMKKAQSNMTKDRNANSEETNTDTTNVEHEVSSIDSDNDECYIDVEHCSSESANDSENEENQSIDMSIFEDDMNETLTTVEKEQYSEECMKKLCDADLWKTIVKLLDESNNLRDFMTLIHCLSTGSIPMDNIVFLLLLERAHFGYIKNTVGMRYRGVTKLFWSIVYRLCKSTGLKFFSGSKHWGTVVSKECAKSQYPGNRSKINFAVPDEKMLREIRSKLPKVIMPGIIHKSLDLLKDQRDVILMADGKLLSKGLGDNFTGDVNLFGHEENPNLQQLKSEVLGKLQFINDALLRHNGVSDNDNFVTLTQIACITTELIQRIRNYMRDKMTKLNKFERQGGYSVKTLSKLRTEIYSACLWSNKARKMNINILHMMATLNTNTNLFSTLSPLNVSQHGNVRMLHDSAYVGQHLDYNEFPHLFVLGSDIAMDLENQSLIPASEAFALMGLDKSTSLKTSYKIHITQELARFTEQITDYQAHLDGLATTTAIFMPSYLPSCTIMYQEGIRLLDGIHHNKLLSCRSSAIVRHHHGNDIEQLKCNTAINLPHDNFSVFINTDAACLGNKMLQQTPNNRDIVSCIIGMHLTNMKKCLYVAVGNVSVSYTWLEMDHSLCLSILGHIYKFYDKNPPSMPDKLRETKNFFKEHFDFFKENKCTAVCEVPRLEGSSGELSISQNFSAYSVPWLKSKNMRTVLIEDDFEILCCEVSKVIEEGFNHLRCEASEILAFVATNTSRSQVIGIPPHLPVAYGLRGHSMSMETMRNMLKDVLGNLNDRNIRVLCEVYDGQFHKLITRSENCAPLTRLQFQLDFFKKIMCEYSKRDLIDMLLPYSEVDEEDCSEIENIVFYPSVIELTSVTLTMQKCGNKRKISISSNSVGDIKFDQFQTKYRRNLWDKLIHPQSTRNIVPNANIQLTETELTDIIRGTRLHRRLQFHSDNYISSESEDDSPDEDYNPSSDSEDSDDSDNNATLNISNLTNLSNTSTTFDGDTCLHRILSKLQRLKKNKHKWDELTTNGFLTNFLSSSAAISKLFLYEMDVINEEIHRSYGKYLFNPKDKKAVRVDKIANQLRRIPNLFRELEVDTLEQNSDVVKLKVLCEEYILSRLYPKEYIAAPVCEIKHHEEVRIWESLSPVQLQICHGNVSQIAFNYPEYNSENKRIEMRTFDYTHILNNLRFHICNRGFDDIQTEAFLKISEENNDILPRAIVEDKLDRQNASISKRFFSEEVENALTKNNNNSEAFFVRMTRKWFEACDKRGVPAEQRLRDLNMMYRYMLTWYRLSDYPPETTHIRGMPIKTFEAILHTISTRFILYGLCDDKSFNNRAISTLAVESFFSDLNRYEFSGLGAPKSVDIPKLLSHIVHVNTTKHDPSRGFEFITSTRGNYPCYLMEVPESIRKQSMNHPFDFPSKRKKKEKLSKLTLSKPKCITRGTRGIRELFRIDESRLTDEQRLGKKVDITKLNF